VIRIPPLLREVAFRRFFLGQSISLIGDQITLLALPLVAVLVLDAHAGEMGLLVAAELAPNLLFSLHAGAFVDRHGHRRRTMIVADLTRAALLLTIPCAYLLDVLSMPQLYVVAFGIGTMSMVFHVAYGSLFVSLVPRERYIEGTSILNGARAFSFVAGPSASGVLVQLVTAPGALVVDVLSYLASAIFMGRISPEEPPTEEATSGHLVAGARFITGNPIVRSALLSTATVNFFNFMFWALFVLYATRTLGVSPGTLGLVLGAASFGGLLGSVVAGRISRRIGVGRTFVLGSALFPAPLLLVPLAGGPEPLVLAMLFMAEFGSGIGVMILDISVGSIFAALVPDRLRSRFMGAYMVVNYGVRPLGALGGGFLGSVVGIRPTLWIATAGAILGVLWLLPSPIPGMRALPESAE
jgi:MFS family permease